MTEIPALKPGEYEKLLQKNYAELGMVEKLPPLVPIKTTSFGAKVWMAMNAVKADHWDDLPGWASWDHLREWHVKRWPFDTTDAPEIIKGNEEYRPYVLRIRKDDLNVLDYAWGAAHYEHRMRYEKTSANPRWAGLLLTVVTAHDPEISKELEQRLKAMRVTIEFRP